MKTSKGATIVIGALFLLFVGAFAAHGEKIGRAHV